MKKLGRAAPLTFTDGIDERQREPVCRQMPWQTEENNNRRNSSRQTIVFCSAYQNTWPLSVKGATRSGTPSTSHRLGIFFSNGLSVCCNCWAVRKFRHLLPFTWWDVRVNSIGRYDMNKLGKTSVNLLYCIRKVLHQPEEVQWRKLKKETQIDGQQMATDFVTFHSSAVCRSFETFQWQTSTSVGNFRDKSKTRNKKQNSWKTKGPSRSQSYQIRSYSYSCTSYSSYVSAAFQFHVCRQRNRKRGLKRYGRWHLTKSTNCVC